MKVEWIERRFTVQASVAGRTALVAAQRERLAEIKADVDKLAKEVGGEATD